MPLQLHLNIIKKSNGKLGKSNLRKLKLIKKLQESIFKNKVTIHLSPSAAGESDKKNAQHYANKLINFIVDDLKKNAKSSIEIELSSNASKLSNRFVIDDIIRKIDSELLKPSPPLEKQEENIVVQYVCKTEDTIKNTFNRL